MSGRSCRDVRADLSAYLEGDLDTTLSGETRSHLERCASCRFELDLLRRTVDALHRLPDLSPPAAIMTGIRARLRPEPWHRRLFGGGLRHFDLPLSAAATLLVVIGITLLLARHPEVTRTVSQPPSAPPPPSPAPREPEKSAPSGPAGTLAEARRGKVQRSEDLAPAPPRRALAKLEPEPPRPAVAPADLAARDEPVPAPPAEQRTSADFLRRAADRGGSALRATLARERAATGARIVCRLSRDGGTVEELAQLLRREGAGDVAISELESGEVRHAAAAHRGRHDFPTEPSEGWTLRATVPWRSFGRLLEALEQRSGLRILEKPAAPGEPADLLALHVTVLR